MWVLVGFAFISGIITILSPCILPILPVVLSGGVSGGKARPFGVVTGFVASFLFFTLSLSALVKATGVSPEIPRYIALVILVAFGIVMILPMLRYRFELWVSGFVSRSKGSRAASQQARPTASAGTLSGYGSGIVMGLGLGIVWTPCVGPIMASVIGLAVGNSADVGAVVITLAYAVGTAIAMLAVILGGKALIAQAPWLLIRSDGISGFRRVDDSHWCRDPVRLGAPVPDGRAQRGAGLRERSEPL